MTLKDQLVALALIIADEAEHNSNFRRRLEEALSPRQPELPIVREVKVHDRKPRDERSSTGLRKGGRRTPAVLDPVALARQNEEVLRQALSALDIEQLKDVVAQYGMDPGKLVMKWKDTARITDRIVEMSMARSTKGDSFRADKLPVENSPPVEISLPEDSSED